MSTYSTTKYVCDLCGAESDSYPTGAPRSWLTISHDPASSNGHLCDECREDVVKALKSARGVEGTVSTPALVEVDAFWCERDLAARSFHQCEAGLPSHRRLYYKEFEA